MYIGHVAVALALKSYEPRIPMAPLALACYGPDWIEVALMIPHPREGMAPYTHSIPAVVIGAIVAALAYAVTARRPGALVILAGWLLHWPADFLTATKPIVGLQPLVGLDLYRLPLADFALETTAVLIGCALYARTFARSSRQRALVIALGTVLAVLQLGVDVVISTVDAGPWLPSLAATRSHAHLVLAGGSARLLHVDVSPSTASTSWSRMSPPS